MSDHNWCHGPECHTIKTQSRVRGSGDNKVLRTIKIKVGRYNGYQNGIWDYFCNHRCLMDFVSLHTQAVINIAPRSKALETPIKVVKEKREGRGYNHTTGKYTVYPYTTTRIIGVDND